MACGVSDEPMILDGVKSNQYIYNYNSFDERKVHVMQCFNNIIIEIQYTYLKVYTCICTYSLL